MATQLIKHLEKCAKQDAIYQPLVCQWSFDEKYKLSTTKYNY